MSRRADEHRWSSAVGIALFLLFSPLILIGGLLYLLSGFFISVAIWLSWCSRGRCILFVYSDSPVWKEYVEKEILPRLENRAVVLNRSKRKGWRTSLAVLAFRRFGGWRAFNPLAVVFEPFRPAKVFRFFEPFHDAKHGNPSRLTQLQAQLFEASNVPTQR